MKRGFSCELYVPSMDKNLRFNEIKVKYLKNIIKYIHNSDNSGLCEYFDEMLEDLCVDDINIKEFDKFDKFCILLGLRTISMGPDLELLFKCEESGNEYTYKTDLIKFIHKLSNIKNAYDDSEVFIDKTLTINLKYPRKFYYENTENILVDCIYNLCINSKKFDMNLVSKQEQENILDKLPNSIINNIDKYITTKSSIFDNIKFFSIKSPFNPNSTPTEIKLNIINNSFLEILKIIYKMNIEEIYNLVYIMTMKLGFNGHYVENNMNLAEAMIYVNKYINELKEREEQSKKTSNSSQQPNSSHLPLSIPFTGIE
jgi:hypothetical protein